MATSQNGWTVIFKNGPDLVPLPPIIGRVRGGDVAVVFKYLLEQFDQRVEKLSIGKDEWGWNVRPIRGQTSGYSNHASGTAVDLNAMRHPRGKRNTFSAAQVREIRKILSELDGVLRWGGDYPPNLSLPDEMHFEINASAARVKAVADRLRGGTKPAGKPTAPAPAKDPNKYPSVEVPTSRKHTAASDAAWRYLMYEVGYKDARLGLALQKWLAGLRDPRTGRGYYDTKRFKLDGDFSKESVKALQRKLYDTKDANGKRLYNGKADGARGPMTVGAEIAYLNLQRKYL